FIRVTHRCRYTERSRAQTRRPGWRALTHGGGGIRRRAGIARRWPRAGGGPAWIGSPSRGERGSRRRTEHTGAADEEATLSRAIRPLTHFGRDWARAPRTSRQTVSGARGLLLWRAKNAAVTRVAGPSQNRASEAARGL